MKIALLIYSLAGGGAERMVSRLANEMSQKGHEITLILLYNREQMYEIKNEVQIVVCSTPNTIKTRRLQAIIYRIKSIRSVLKNIQADVIFAFMISLVPYAVLAAKGLRTKVIGAERANPNILKKKWKLVIRIFSPFCDGYVFQTNGAKNSYPKNVAKKSIVIGNIAPECKERKKNQEQIEKSFCSVGRLNNDKDYLTLFKAILLVKQKIPSIQITIWGQGSKEKEYKQIVKNYGIEKNVVFAGFSKNILEELTNYQYFIFSSRAEGMPNALLEAMSVGLECISTDCDFGPGELIENGKNGWLVPVGDAKAMAERITYCLDNYDKHEQICEKAKQIRKKYSLNSVMNAYVDYAIEVYKG